MKMFPKELESMIARAQVAVPKFCGEERTMSQDAKIRRYLRKTWASSTPDRRAVLESDEKIYRDAIARCKWTNPPGGTGKMGYGGRFVYVFAELFAVVKTSEARDLELTAQLAKIKSSWN